MKTTGIIGIDVATVPKRTGISFAEFLNPRARLIHAMVGDPLPEIVRFIKGYDRVLLAMDAPLGWPTPLRKALECHQAGEPLDCEANDLFRRQITAREPALRRRLTTVARQVKDEDPNQHELLGVLRRMK